MMGLFALTFRKAPFEGPATASATRDGSRRRTWDLAVGLVTGELPGVSVNLTASPAVVGEQGITRGRGTDRQ